jgi:hypothetical protein
VNLSCKLIGAQFAGSFAVPVASSVPASTRYIGPWRFYGRVTFRDVRPGWPNSWLTSVPQKSDRGVII